MTITINTKTNTVTIARQGTQGPPGGGGGGADLSDNVPHALGTAAAGTGTKASRDDHVHAMPTAADVGADAAGTATAAVAAHVGAADPHPQYTTPSEAAAVAPVQTVAGRTGAVTLSVGDVADAVDTADARLSDAREWTAATVTQAEAEAGADTNRKAWTVQRIWQAIAAWWAGSSAKTKLDGIATGATVGADWNTNVSNKPTLGTAAAKNIPASGDAAAGEVVKGDDSRLSDARTPTTHTHPLSELQQSGATDGQVVTWDNATTSWKPKTPSGGGGSPGGSDKQLQYNNAGAFAGASTAYWDETNKRLSIGAGASPSATMHAKAASAANIVGIFQGTASQTGKLTEWQDSAGTVVANMSNAGKIVSAEGLSAPKANSKGYVFGEDSNWGLLYTFGTYLELRVSGTNFRFYDTGIVSTNVDATFTSHFNNSGKTVSVAGNNVNLAGAAGTAIVRGGNHLNGDKGGEAKVLGGNSNGTNIAGATVTIQGGIATGNATPGTVVVQTTSAGSSGTTAQTVRTVATFDGNTTSGESPFLLLDLASGSLKRVSFGADDSGGTGYKLLRVTN